MKVPEPVPVAPMISSRCITSSMVLKPDVCHATVIRLLVPVEPSQ